MKAIRKFHLKLQFAYKKKVDEKAFRIRRSKHGYARPFDVLIAYFDTALPCTDCILIKFFLSGNAVSIFLLDIVLLPLKLIFFSSDDERIL